MLRPLLLPSSYPVVRRFTQCQLFVSLGQRKHHPLGEQERLLKQQGTIGQSFR
jgi:hypothetical protein